MAFKLIWFWMLYYF